MLICLSSGDRPRYRQDVLRAIALPTASQLQFRYDRRWVSDRVLQMIEAGTIVGQNVLIVYADQSRPADGSTPSGPIELLPVRLAKIVSAALPGQTVSLIFLLGSVTYASDLGAFNNDVSNLTGHSLPRWADDKPAGLYFTEMPSRPTTFVEIDDLGHWEELVTQIASRRDFDGEETFFTVIGLTTEDEWNGMGASLRHLPWPKELPADAYRELILYHYHPSKSPTDLVISVSVGPELRLESRAKSRLDSRYDVKRFRVRSGDPALGSQGSWINLTAEGAAVPGPFELEIRIQVSGNWLKRLGITAAIAAGLTGAQIIPLVTRGDLNTVEQVASGLLVFLVSMVAGGAVAWGIRRSI